MFADDALSPALVRLPTECWPMFFFFARPEAMTYSMFADDVVSRALKLCRFYSILADDTFSPALKRGLTACWPMRPCRPL